MGGDRGSLGLERRARPDALAEGRRDPATGEGTITLNFNDGFSCDAPPCVTTEFEFFVTVRDAGGQESPFASLLITSLGTQ